MCATCSDGVFVFCNGSESVFFPYKIKICRIERSLDLSNVTLIFFVLITEGVPGKSTANRVGTNAIRRQDSNSKRNRICAGYNAGLRG